MTGAKKILMFLISVSLFAVIDVFVFAEVYSVADAKAGVCILSYDTEFKNKLSAALVEELNAKKITVTVDTFSNSDQHSPADYEAVVLLSGIEAFHPLPEAVDYIKTHDYAGNIIYFSTYTLFKIPYGFALKRRKLDAITSASNLEKDHVLEEAIKKIIAQTVKIIE